jgi:hypothetical protein
MSFDIHAAVFDEQGRYLEEPAARYEAALLEQFAASPEGQAITERGTELGWAGVLVHYAITYPGVTPPTMTAGDLEEVVYDLFPRKVVTEPGDGAGIIQELRARLSVSPPRLPSATRAANARALDSPSRRAA